MMNNEHIMERRLRVLRAVVEVYIQDPIPVGSRFVTKRFPFNLSPATIRNIMADLEELGYLRQPHTSAGRVPTDKGFRMFVDSLDREAGRSEADAITQSLRKRFKSVRDDVNRLLGEVTETVSGMTHCLVFALPLRAANTTLNRIQLYRYRGRKTVAVLLTNEGLITNRVLDSDFGLTQREMDRISDFLNSEFSGSTLGEIRRALVERMSNEKALCDILITRAVKICTDALNVPGGEMILSGLPDLLGLPEFSDHIDRIAKAMEDKRTIIGLLDGIGGCGDGGDCVHVAIGAEIPDENLRDLSIITADYRQGGRSLGAVGIIGPLRMDYSRAIPLVDAMARVVSASISS